MGIMETGTNKVTYIFEGSVDYHHFTNTSNNYIGIFRVIAVFVPHQVYCKSASSDFWRALIKQITLVQQHMQIITEDNFVTADGRMMQTSRSPNMSIAVFWYRINQSLTRLWIEIFNQCLTTAICLI